MAKFTEEQWQAMIKLRPIGTGKRQNSPTSKALKMVLVGGSTIREAAETQGISRQCVNTSVCVVRECISAAKVLAKAPYPKSNEPEQLKKFRAEKLGK